MRMGKFSPKRSFHLGITITILTSLILLFQNCAGNNLGTGTSLSSEITKDSKILATEAKVFPFEVSINQVAYMSCTSAKSYGGLNLKTFTFRVGGFATAGTDTAALALKEGGMRVHPNYLTEFNQAFSNLTPSVRETKLFEALSAGALTKNTQLQLAVRSTQTGLRTTVYARGNSPENQVDNIMDPLSDIKIANQLVQDSKSSPIKYSSYFSALPDQESRPLQGALSIPTALGPDEGTFRSEMANNMLVVGFVNSEVSSDTTFGNMPLTKNKSSKDSMFGNGFSLGFTKPPNVNFSGYPSRTLTSITEYDLSGTRPNATGSTWNCGLKMKIVRDADRLKNIYVAGGAIRAACPYEPIASQTSPTARAQLQILRRFLPAENWDINLTHKCIVPRNGLDLCYEGSSDPIVYDEYFIPFRSNPSDPYVGCSVSGQLECAHYVTVCYKN
jgi:hypothetical protein